MTGADAALPARLAARLAARMRRDGPIGVDAYMRAALGDPEAGYYMRRDPFGSAGDFTTAPEISQMFGELIGAWCIDRWQAMGRPAPFALAELGPGRGTLMADLLRVAHLDPAFDAAARIHLVETSPALREAQRRALGDRDVAWLDSIDAAPGTPLLAVANEFFDALPIRQFVSTSEGWRERCIEPDPAGGDTAFRFTLAPADDTATLPLPVGLPDGAIVEQCADAQAIAGRLAGQIARHGGAALIVDYGYAAGHGDTLQAVRRHGYADPLVAPGEADLTAHVDFAALSAAGRAAGIIVSGPVTQGAFLRALGIEARAAALSARATPDQRTDIEGALRRLIDDDEMGTLFKVLAFTAPGQSAPAGFPADAGDRPR